MDGKVHVHVCTNFLCYSRGRMVVLNYLCRKQFLSKQDRTLSLKILIVDELLVKWLTYFTGLPGNMKVLVMILP